MAEDRPATDTSAGWGAPFWVAGSAALPALLAARELTTGASSARDVALIRTVGLGSTGGFRALDPWVAALFAALPFGTRVLRAELPGVFLLATCAALAFVVVRRLLIVLAPGSAWASVVAALATATVSLSHAFQHEAVVPGSRLLGVTFLLLALNGRRLGLASRAALVTLALTYELPIGLTVLVATVGPALAYRSSSKVPRPSLWTRTLPVILGGAFGIVPFLLAAGRSNLTPLSTSARLFGAPFGEDRGPASARHAIELLVGEVGEVVLILAVVGVVLGLARRAARTETLPLLAVGVVAGGAFLLGGDRDAGSATGLVTLFMAALWASLAMQEGVLRVARARLPLASASAAMVVVLEGALPAVQLDDTLARTAKQPLQARSSWNDALVAGVPSGALLLVATPRLYTAVLSTEASGDLPGDYAALPLFAPANERSAAALAHDRKLVPLFRDLALTGTPQELSLSTLAASHPLALATDPLWERTLTRHLIPTALLSVFEPEPRGGADRKHALEESEPMRQRLLTKLGTPKEPTLTALSAAILLDRAVAAAQAGEREVALLAIQDASSFLPKDPRLQQLALREAASKGPVDAHDLARQGLWAP